MAIASHLVSELGLELVVQRLDFSESLQDIGVQRIMWRVERLLESVNDELSRFEECVRGRLSAFTPPLKVLTSRQGIRFAHLIARAVGDFVVVVGQ